MRRYIFVLGLLVLIGVLVFVFVPAEWGSDLTDSLDGNSDTDRESPSEPDVRSFAPENIQSQRSVPADDNQDVSVDEPLFDVVRISATGEALVAGRAPKNAVVTVLVDGQDVGMVEADSQGRFVHLLEEALPPGEYQLALRAEAGSGALVNGKEAIVVLVPYQPLEMGDEAKQQPLVILIPGDDTKVATLLQRQFPVDKAPLGPHFTVDTVEYHSLTAKLTLTGEAYGDRLTLVAYVDNQPLDLKRLQGSGSTPVRWQLSGVPDTIPGEHELRIDMVVANRVVLRRLLTYTHHAGDHFDNQLEEVVIQRGDTLWKLAVRLLGRGYRYVVIYEENRDQIADPDMIYPGQRLRIPLTEGVAPLDVDNAG